MTIENKSGIVVISADIGNVFRSKVGGEILTNKLYLGCNDSADNYEEIIEVEIYEETENDTVQTEETKSENGVQ